MNRVVLLRNFGGALVLILLPSFANAHSGHSEAASFMYGLAHPFGGSGHLFAMLAVGLWAVQVGGRSLWVMPLTFISVMALGGALPMLAIDLPVIELGILLSLLLLGVMIAAAIRLPLVLGSTLVGMFALWHGYAHGAEIPASTSGLAYTTGFVLATALLHLTGIAFGWGLKRLMREYLLRFAGAGIALFGTYLVVM